MAKRNISATIQIGAKTSASVNSTFAGLKGKIDALGAQAAKLKTTSKGIEALGRAEAKLASSRKNIVAMALNKQGNVAAAEKSRAAYIKQVEAVNKLRASLKAAGVDTSKLASENDRLGRALAGVETRMQGFVRLGARINALKGSLRGVGDALAGVRGHLKGLALVSGGLAAAGVAGAVKAGKGFLDTAVDFERYAIQLEAFGENAQTALSWSTQFAAKTPLDVDQVTQAYVKLRQAGIDPTDGTLQALTDSTFKSGKTFDDLQESIRQLGHAWGKEKLTAEDANILVERGIPVYEMLSRAMKKSKKEIFEMQSKGMIGRRMMRAMLFESGKWSEGTSERMAKLWDGIMGRMGDHWVQFKRNVMDNGVFDSLKKRLEGLLKSIEELDKNGTLKRWAKITSDYLNELLAKIIPLDMSSEDLAKTIEGVGNKLRKTTDNIIAFAKGAWAAVTSVKEFVGGWENFGLVIAGVVLAPTIASVVSLTSALWTLGAAATAALGPWGLLAAGVIAAGFAIHHFKDDIMDLINSAIDPLLDKLRAIGAWFQETRVAKFLGLDGEVKDNRIQTPFRAPDMEQDKRNLLQNIMPAKAMPGAQSSRTINNNVDVKIDARGMNPEQLKTELGSYLKRLPIGDSTGVMGPE